MITNFMGLQE